MKILKRIVLFTKGNLRNSMKEHYTRLTLVLTLLFMILLSFPCYANDEDFIEAVYKGNILKVQTLLNKGADVNARDGLYNTALIIASQNGHTDIVKALLDKGADVNLKAINQVTALIYASSKGYGSIVRALLDKGADVNAKTIKEGATSLIWASYNGS